MGGVVSCCCRLFGRSSGRAEYKKIEAQSVDDIEFGKDNDDWGSDEHDDWEPGTSGAAPVVAVPAEPEPEPEPDPFADFGMAPSIQPTKRHAAVSAWERPAAISGRLAVSNLVAQDAEAEDGDGWGDDELEGLGGTDRRRAAKERRDASRREREAQGLCNTSTRLKVAATKVSGD